jgi:hypothetical protein
VLVSVAVAVKEKLPVALGLPDKVPLGASVKPAGRAPAVMAKLYGAVPPRSRQGLAVGDVACGLRQHRGNRQHAARGTSLTV